ncbi:tetraspanin-3-like isoform X1 [Gouania willdenowi]|uniref:Tetraspanin-3-like n=1 Tax=Gouania willdenowi TaxID=441366 RepID=A0A8C5D2C0_GOUWI|nr:tetraspanin-3-like isoform X1 [Gouania willdenowi]
MARCRTFLRGLSICVTVLLMGSGVVMIGVGLSSINENIPVLELFEHLPSSDGLLVLQVFGPLTIVLSGLGICATTLDLKPLLMAFSVLLFVEFVALLIVAAPLVQVQAQMDREVDELFLNVTPLHKAHVDIQRELDKLQASESCCGLRSYEDWENQQPTSCFCSTTSHSSSEQLQCVSVEGRGPEEQQVHSEACGTILKNHLSFPIKLRIAIISAFATITMVAVPLCVALSLEKHWSTPPVETTVDVFNRVNYRPKPSLT